MNRRNRLRHTSSVTFVTIGSRAIFHARNYLILKVQLTSTVLVGRLKTVELSAELEWRYSLSTTSRKPTVAERSMLGDIIRSFPCSVSLYACGKYQMEPCGW